MKSQTHRNVEFEGAFPCGSRTSDVVDPSVKFNLLNLVMVPRGNSFPQKANTILRALSCKTINAGLIRE